MVLKYKRARIKLNGFPQRQIEEVSGVDLSEPGYIRVLDKNGDKYIFNKDFVVSIDYEEVKEAIQ